MRLVFKTLLLVILPALLLTNCKSSENERTAVAKVYDHYLYLDELQTEIPAGLTENDSVLFVTNFINAWISQKLLLHQAENNLSELQKDFSRQLEEYRQSLLIYSYERELINQRLDTIVTEEQILNFYSANKDLFVLRDNIVKVVYMKMEHKAPNVNLIKNYVKNANAEDLQKLNDYGPRYAANYYLDDENWLFFSDLLKEIPIKSYDYENFLRNNRFIEIKDSLYFYFVNIKNFMIKESTSPVDFEKERIAEMIVNRRKVELIDKMQQEILQEATAKGKIKVY